MNGYVKFLCGGTKEAPAKLEFYADINSSTIQKILFFADVEKVEYTEDQMKSYITITMKDNGNGMTFCADSSEATKEWFWCCLTLKAIPYYPIPEFPTENLISEKLINQHCDSKRFGAGKFICIHEKALSLLLIINRNTHYVGTIALYVGYFLLDSTTETLNRSEYINFSTTALRSSTLAIDYSKNI